MVATPQEGAQTGAPHPHTQIKRRNTELRIWISSADVLTGILGVVPPGHDTRRTVVQLHHWREIVVVFGRPHTTRSYG
jgi:hypothetical protein